MNLDFNKWLAFEHMARLGLFDQHDDEDNDGPIIRELDDDDEGSSTTSFRFTIDKSSPFEKVKELEAKTSSYLDTGNYEEAYGLVKKQSKLGTEVNFIPILVQYYVTLINTDRADQANKIRSELVSVIKRKMKVSPMDAERHGKNLLRKKKYFEAILFYHVSSELCQNPTNSDDAFKALQGSSIGTRQAITKLWKDAKVPNHVIKEYVFNDMRKFKERIKSLPIEDKKLSCLAQALCLHHLECCEGLVGDIDSREVSIQEGIDLMRKHLGSDAEKHELLGNFFHSRGHVYLIKKQPNEAVRDLQQAISLKKKAESYQTYAERQEDIKVSETLLQLAQRQT